MRIVHGFLPAAFWEHVEKTMPVGVRRWPSFTYRQVEHVLLFDFPRDPIEYMRRVGRTARAGRKGVVTVLAWGRQVGLHCCTINKPVCYVHRDTWTLYRWAAEWHSAILIVIVLGAWYSYCMSGVELSSYNMAVYNAFPPVSVCVLSATSPWRVPPSDHLRVDNRGLCVHSLQ